VFLYLEKVRGICFQRFGFSKILSRFSMLNCINFYNLTYSTYLIYDYIQTYTYLHILGILVEIRKIFAAEWNLFLGVVFYYYTVVYKHCSIRSGIQKLRFILSLTRTYVCLLRLRLTKLLLDTNWGRFLRLGEFRDKRDLWDYLFSMIWTVLLLITL